MTGAESGLQKSASVLVDVVDIFQRNFNQQMKAIQKVVVILQFQPTTYLRLTEETMLVVWKLEIEKRQTVRR